MPPSHVLFTTPPPLRRQVERLESLCGDFLLLWLRHIDLVLEEGERDHYDECQVRHFIQSSLHPRILQLLVNRITKHYHRVSCPSPNEKRQNGRFSSGRLELLRYFLHQATSQLELQSASKGEGLKLSSHHPAKFLHDISLRCSFNGAKLIKLRIPAGERGISERDRNVSIAELLSDQLTPYNLRHLDLSSNADVNDLTLAAVGRQCPNLQFLDLGGCGDAVTDVGIQNLVFPASVLKIGEVNLAAASSGRVKTNALTKRLRYLDLCGTGVGLTGCVIALQFVARLSKPEGRLRHSRVGDALEYITKLLGIRSWHVEELYDSSPSRSRFGLYTSLIPGQSTIRALHSSDGCKTLHVFDNTQERWMLDLKKLWLENCAGQVEISAIRGTNLTSLSITGLKRDIHLDIISSICPNVTYLECDRAVLESGIQNQQEDLLAKVQTMRLGVGDESSLKILFSLQLESLETLELDLGRINSDRPSRLFRKGRRNGFPVLDSLRLSTPLHNRGCHEGIQLLEVLRQFSKLRMFGPVEHWLGYDVQKRRRTTTDEEEPTAWEAIDVTCIRENEKEKECNKAEIGRKRMKLDAQIGDKEMSQLLENTLETSLNFAREINWDLTLECFGLLHMKYYGATSSSHDAFDPWKHRYEPDAGRIPISEDDCKEDHHSSDAEKFCPSSPSPNVSAADVFAWTWRDEGTLSVFKVLPQKDKGENAENDYDGVLVIPSEDVDDVSENDAAAAATDYKNSSNSAFRSSPSTFLVATSSLDVDVIGIGTIDNTSVVPEVQEDISVPYMIMSVSEAKEDISEAETIESKSTPVHENFEDIKGINESDEDISEDETDEYDLGWYWDYGEQVWKKCDPSEWDKEDFTEENCNKAVEKEDENDPPTLFGNDWEQQKDKQEDLTGTSVKGKSVNGSTLTTTNVEKKQITTGAKEEHKIGKVESKSTSEVPQAKKDETGASLGNQWIMNKSKESKRKSASAIVTSSPVQMLRDQLIMRTTSSSSLVGRRLQKDYELAKVAKIRKRRSGYFD